MNLRNNEKGNVGLVAAIAGAVIVVALVVGLIIFGIVRSTNKHTVTFTVNKSERVQDQDGQGAKYMVYTDNGVYQNTDSLMNNKFNSADLYNMLQVGKKYECTAVGYRNSVMSMFENLIDCKEVK